MESSAYFFDKAEQCRRLAASIVSHNDPSIATLHALAAEFERKAIEAATRENDDMTTRHPLPSSTPHRVSRGGSE